MKKLNNKFAKVTSFVSLTARDAFSTRPLQRRYAYLMKNLGLFVAIFFLSASGQAQKEDDAEGIVLYEYKFPIPMVYVHKEAKVFVALDGHGKKTMYEFKCEADSELFDFKYFSKEYLEEMNCDSYLNSESK